MNQKLEMEGYAMKQRIYSKTLTLLLILLLPLTSVAGKYPQVLMDQIDAAKKATPVVSLDEFKAAIDDSSIWIVDVREPAEYAAGHVRNAINIPRGVIEFHIWEKVGYPDKTNMGQKMFLYCKKGGRCALAANSLRSLGFTEVYRTNLDIEQWVEAGNVLIK